METTNVGVSKNILSIKLGALLLGVIKLLGVLGLSALSFSINVDRSKYYSIDTPLFYHMFDNTNILPNKLLLKI